MQYLLYTSTFLFALFIYLGNIFQARMHNAEQEPSENAVKNVASATWEFTAEDLNFSLFGYFTSKDEHIGVNQRLRGNICFTLLFKTFELRLCLFTSFYKDYCSFKKVYC